MQSRKILFVLSNSSSQKSIMSEAETLGALKADMHRAGINYENMAFFEGRTRTELKDDASVLPTNVPVAAKGTIPASTTNELVFMLTTANKKIASGALSGERKAVLEEIKVKGLSRAVIAKFGKNATQCKTPDLIAFLSEATPPTQPDSIKSEPVEEVPVLEIASVNDNATVTIINVGNNVKSVTKVLKESIKATSKQVKEIIEGVPSIIAGLTKEHALKFKDDLTAAGATVEIGEIKPEVTTPPVQAGPCVDVQARNVLERLIDKLMNEYELGENYEELLDDLKTEEAPVEATISAPTETKKVGDDKLSKDEINDLFGGWAK